MDMATRMEPRTPNQEVEEDFDLWFLEFSNFYNLNLRRPNPSFVVEPTQATPYYEDSSFYFWLRDQYRQGNADIVIRIFDKSAREIHSRWVKKTHGERDITPATTNLPRVASETERTRLLDRLAEILACLSPDSRSSSSSLRISRRSKRPSDDGSTTSPSSKRSRGVMPPSRPPTVLSRLDSGEVRVSTPLPERFLSRNGDGRSSRQQSFAREEDPYMRPISINTSNTSFVSRVFTEPDVLDEDALPSTQQTEVTHAKSSQRKLRAWPATQDTELTDDESTQHRVAAWRATQDAEYTDDESAQYKMNAWPSFRSVKAADAESSRSKPKSMPTTQITETIVETMRCDLKAMPSSARTAKTSSTASSRTARPREAPVSNSSRSTRQRVSSRISSSDIDRLIRDVNPRKTDDATIPADAQSDSSADDRDVLPPDIDANSSDDEAVTPTNEVSFNNIATVAADATAFEKRLQDVWPIFPSHLQKAPLAVRWEIMRVALHCGVSMEQLHLTYEPILNDQTRLWEELRRLDAFKGKSLPEKSRPEAWNAAMSNRFCSTDQVVVLTASLTVNPGKEGPPFRLRLQPLKMDLPHRLDRRFGSDRFLELTIPSLYTKEMKTLSRDNASAIECIHRFLVRGLHFVLGRRWTSFYVKQATPKKIFKDDTLRPETVTIMQERMYFFAEDGNDFVHAGSKQSESPKHESCNAHTKMGRDQLIGWLLQVRKNQEQSVYKLFSRIALGLSRTHPTVVLQPDQIRHRDTDLLSPIQKVMNDGIGRMSTALARQIRDMMGLDDIPAGFQGRFGSAKGFWIRDTEDMSNDIWIETYPSQRKWKCDYKEEDNRTFEVRNASKELKSATLNLQLLPILEDRAIDAAEMKEKVGKFMRDSLEYDMQSQKDAMQDAAHFKLWVHENGQSKRREDRARLGHVPWTAGLPVTREDQVEFLLSHGFQPTKLEFLRKMAFDLRKEKCEELQTRLNVRVGRSTYAYMVIDFNGVLAEDEIHLGFSSKFSDEKSGFSETFLHGMDVLVARTPAHYPSDIQRVKAVFKPELGSLKDVIIFPSKGNIPLADKLSGGDYDGDIAWVCWEPSIVNNFSNAAPPDPPDLFKSGVLTKVKETYQELAKMHGSKGVFTEFIDKAFRFNMEQNLLGTCTNYKERLCYANESVRDETAIFLSTLISNLVDRAKQGIVFSEEDWNKERKRLNAFQRNPQRASKRLDPLQPQYKNSDWGGGRDSPPTHIIDYVKFVIGKPTVEKELKELDRYLGRAEQYDKDLVRFAEFFEKLKRPPDVRKKDEAAGKSKKNTWETVLEDLKCKIDAVVQHWVNSNDEFDAKLSTTFDMWRNIGPSDKVNSNTVRALCEVSLTDVGLSQWDLLKASYCFKMHYKKNFSWYVAGYQLAYLKSIAVSQGVHAPPALLTPSMYAGVKPDGRYVRAMAALNEGRRAENGGGEMEDVEVSDPDE